MIRSSRPIPTPHRVRSHPQLVRELAAAARIAFADADKAWDPSRDRNEAPDPGRGLLDSFALPLHVLWTYQDAWAREGFLPTLRLDVSRARLLELVAPAPTPGIAATGLQHFRVKPGRQLTLPPRYRLTAPAADGRPEATFETLVAAEVSATRNIFLPYLPSATATPDTSGNIAYSAQLLDPEVLTPPPDAALLPQLERRLAAGRAGDIARRNADRQRARARARAETLNELQATGMIDPFSAAFQALCDEACQAQRLANEVPPGESFSPLSEAQEMLLGQLGRIARRHPDALQGFDEALSRRSDESDADWNRRLDLTANFLDTLVTGLLQQSRDQVARLRGPDALTALDRAYRGEGSAEPTQPDRGRTDPGCDSFFLLPTRDDSESRTQAEHVRPGDWLVVSELLDGIGANGEPQTQRLYREALRVTRVRDEVPELGTDARPMTRIVFEPALTRGYRLSAIEILGNCVPVSHGKTVRRTVARGALGGQGLALTDAPLTWLPDPSAPSGRAAAVSLRINGQDWLQVPESTAGQAPPGTFFLMVGPDGVASLRVGAGEIDAPIPPAARIEIAYREGSGPDGNRDPMSVNQIDRPDPALAGTFNPLPIHGGVAPETPEEAQSAGIAASILDRAVSTSDVQTLALAYGSVRRALVFRDALRARERLTVVVSGIAAAPLEPAELMALTAYLSARVAPGVSISVENRQRADIRARIRLAIVPSSDPLATIATARIRLGLGRAVDQPPGLLDPEATELGRDVHLSDLHGALAGIADLAAVHVEALYRATRTPHRADRIEIAPRELPLWASQSTDREPVEIIWEEARDLP